MRCLICKPDLRVPFKPALAIPQDVSELRVNWDKFVNRAAKVLDAKVLERPMWQFTPELIRSYEPDLVLVPHKQKFQFDPEIPTLYYMQTALPWLFTVDPQGWGAGASGYPFKPYSTPDSVVFEDLKVRIEQNLSKFKQPERKQLDLPENYIFFPCQIPYDETIRYHSDVSEEEVVFKLSKWCEDYNLPLVMKEHPANRASMKPLHEISHDAIWVDASVHDLIEGALKVCTINSGVGVEAMLHEKPVITFGRAEYDCVTTKGYLDDLDTTFFENGDVDIASYRLFFDWFVNYAYNVNDPVSFEKLGPARSDLH